MGKGKKSIILRYSHNVLASASHSPTDPQRKYCSIIVREATQSKKKKIKIRNNKQPQKERFTVCSLYFSTVFFLFGIYFYILSTLKGSYWLFMNFLRPSRHLKLQPQSFPLTLSVRLHNARVGYCFKPSLHLRLRKNNKTSTTSYFLFVIINAICLCGEVDEDTVIFFSSELIKKYYPFIYFNGQGFLEFPEYLNERTCSFTFFISFTFTFLSSTGAT